MSNVGYKGLYNNPLVRLPAEYYILPLYVCPSEAKILRGECPKLRDLLFYVINVIRNVEYGPYRFSIIVLLK